jgi:hypothetical protein
MGLIQRLWVKWRKIDPHYRREIKQNATWIGAYLIGIPVLLYFSLIAVYDIQTKAAVKLTVPEEVNDKNYQEWLKRQQKKGKFLEPDD